MNGTPMALEDRPDLPDWTRQAALAILELAHEKWTFTADDLRERVPEAPHPNLIGGVFQTARKAGVIKPIGYDMSRTKSRKHSVVRVWTRKINHEEKK